MHKPLSKRILDEGFWAPHEIEKKYLKLVEFVKFKSLPELSNNEISHAYYILDQKPARLAELNFANSCRTILEEIGEL